MAAHAEGRAAAAAAILGATWNADNDEDRLRFLRHYLVPDLAGFTLAAGDPAAARLYLSRRTVQFHVSSILAKLGAVSRVELATMVIRHHSAPT